MTNQVMTNKQYNLLAQLNSLIESMNNEDKEFQELVNDADIFGGNVDDIQGDIESRIEIVGLIKQYEHGGIKDSAVIGVSNTMSIVIVEAESDYVFGYYDGSDRNFFLSDVEFRIEDEEDEEEESVPMFQIGNDEESAWWSLGKAMRIR